MYLYQAIVLMIVSCMIGALGQVFWDRHKQRKQLKHLQDLIKADRETESNRIYQVDMQAINSLRYPDRSVKTTVNEPIKK